MVSPSTSPAQTSQVNSQINQVRPVTARKNPGNGFTVITVHYSADPDKNTESWISEAHKGLSERAWNREYEIDYTSFAGKPFYPEFQNFNIATQEYDHSPGDILYRGWDFGFHRPCVVITLLNQFDQWVIIKTILGENESIMTFGKRVRNFCQSTYPSARYIDACDVAGFQVNDKSEFTSVQVLNSLGIYPRSRKQPIKQGAEIIRQKLGIRIDGKPGLLINLSEEYVITAFRGGLHYPEAREGRGEGEFYEKDGYYEHVGDTLRYIATEMFTVIGQNQDTNQISRDPVEDRYKMGSPYTSEDMWGQDEEESTGGINEYF